MTRHKALYSQIPSITKAKSVAEAVKLQQIRLENLENEVRFLLKENDRWVERDISRVSPFAGSVQGLSICTRPLHLLHMNMANFGQL